MTKKEFETYFYKIVDKYLLRSLDDWQVDRIRAMCMKSVLKGKRLSKKRNK